VLQPGRVSNASAVVAAEVVADALEVAAAARTASTARESTAPAIAAVERHHRIAGELVTLASW